MNHLPPLSSNRVGILLFPGFEVLDACGPFEVFASVRDEHGRPVFETVTIAENQEPVRSVGGLTLWPDHSFTNCPRLRVLVVPGGAGRKDAMHRKCLLAWIREQYKDTDHVLSVCTGAFIVAASGIMAARTPVTTHHSAYDELEQAFPHFPVQRGARWIDSGPITFAAGISAGIDASLHLVARLCGPDAAHAVATRMEYPMPDGAGSHAGKTAP